MNDAIGREKFLEKCMDDPALFRAVFEKREQVRDGKFPRKFVDIIFQSDPRERDDLFNYYVFIDAYIKVMNGTLAFFSVPVSGEPHGDICIESNNAILKNLPFPFSGEFFGGKGAGADGYISWSVPIHCAVCIENEVKWAIAEPGDAPLEVGTNSAGKFKEFLYSNVKLARWPYGQDFITVFIQGYTYGEGHPKFDGLKSQLQETIEDAIKSKRNPWDLIGS